MKTNERHHLKDNELAHALGDAQTWANDNSKNIITIVAAIVIVGGSVLGFTLWRSSTDNKARTLLAEAMVVEESRIAPPAPPTGTTNDPNAIGGQQPGTYPTEQAKLEAALPKFKAAADAFPTHDAGITARYHLAKTLVGLGKYDEAMKEYDQVIASGAALLSKSAKLGKAQAQMLAAQYEPAITTFKQIADAKDPQLPSEAVLMELARAYKAAGKADDAKKTLTEIVEQHADSPYASEARAEIDRMKS